MKRTTCHERSEVGGTAPLGALAEPSRSYTYDFDPVPSFLLRESKLRIIVASGIADDGDLVSRLRQAPCQVARVLSGRDDVRIESLVQDQHVHWPDTSSVVTAAACSYPRTIHPFVSFGSSSKPPPEYTQSV